MKNITQKNTVNNIGETTFYIFFLEKNLLYF